MYPRSLKSKLLFAIAALVLASGILVSQLISHRYHLSLFQGAASEAKRIAHNLALDLTDKILINDRIAVQKMLDDLMLSNPSVAYLFITRNRQVLTHTFDKGVPVALIGANTGADPQNGHLEKIVSDSGEHYLDIAWPIFDGKAGLLRLGFSERTYRQKVSQLWLEISVITFSILLLSLVGAHFFIRRITKPLMALAKAAEKIDEGHLDVNLTISGDHEVGLLAASFQKMMQRINHYMHQLRQHAAHLEEKNRQLDRAYSQTRVSFAIVQEIGTLQKLQDAAAYLFDKFQEIITCENMALVIVGTDRQYLLALTRDLKRTLDETSAGAFAARIEGIERFTVIEDATSITRFLPGFSQNTDKVAAFPIRHEQEVIGALLIGCKEDCRCVSQELEVIDLLLSQTAGALRRSILQEEEIMNLRKQMEQSAEYHGLVGKDPQMQTIYRLIEDVAATDATVLIQGESGTGKELVARAIHRQSPRKKRPFVVINCSAYPSTLLESEIFGHERGAFTGAVRQKPGRFEQANGGTVFLDEIGEMSLSAQIKLLRVLQSRKFERLGGEQTLEVDVRVLAATNKNLLERVKEGHFREDLFYRLNVVPINLSPLKNRRNDIPLLARHFLHKFSEMQNKPLDDFSPEAMRLLLNYFWPGNVRELENSVEHAVVLAKGNSVEPLDLPEAVLAPRTEEIVPPKTIYDNEMNFLQQVLEECNWNKTAAAERLGISRSTLYEKLKKYSITPPTLH